MGSSFAGLQHTFPKETQIAFTFPFYSECDVPSRFFVVVDFVSKYELRKDAPRTDVQSPNETVCGACITRHVPLLQVQPIQAETEGERKKAFNRARTSTSQQ
ncbi:hypothetical protein Trydic_g19447 [Trypoxylus dichotomus]